MCDSEVADAQLVHSAQSTQTAVNRMSTFYPNQTRCLILFKGVQYICNNIFILVYIKNYKQLQIHIQFYTSSVPQ